MIRFTNPPGRIVPGETETQRAVRIRTESCMRSDYLRFLRKARTADPISVGVAICEVQHFGRLSPTLINRHSKIIARAARKVAREADKLVAYDRMVAVAQACVEAGIAEWNKS